MAVRDLLWACPRCVEAALAPSRGGDRCPRCGTLYARGRGDRIIARSPGGEEEVRPAAAWLDQLPVERLCAEGAEAAILRRVRPSMREVRYEGELIGWVERFGDPVEGTVLLTDEGLSFTASTGQRTELPLDDLTSIQPSSRMLVLGQRGGAALSLEFPESSVLRWELLLQNAVQRRWAASGRGTVVEYQPRIVAR